MFTQTFITWTSLAIFLSFAAVLSGCESSNVKPSASSAATVHVSTSSDLVDFSLMTGEQIRQYIAGCTASGQRTVFNTLTAAQKASAFQSKITHVLNREDLSQSQRNFLNDLRTVITDSLYLDPMDSVERRDFVQHYLQASIDAGFEPVTYGRIVYSLNDFNEDFELVPDGLDDPNGGNIGYPACHCSRGSLFTACDWASVTCIAAQCIRSQSGCGTLWLSACTGLCEGPSAAAEIDITKVYN